MGGGGGEQSRFIPRVHLLSLSDSDSKSVKYVYREEGQGKPVQAALPGGVVVEDDVSGLHAQVHGQACSKTSQKSYNTEGKC